MQNLKLSELHPVARPARGSATLTVVPRPDVVSDPVRGAAEARVQHALRRSVQEFLDRSGFVELDSPAGEMLSAALGRACWPVAGGVLEGTVAGASGEWLFDLLERALLAALQGSLNRAAADLAVLGVDADHLKYVGLPLRRVRRDAAAGGTTGSPWAALPAVVERAILAEGGEPVAVVDCTPVAADLDEAPPRLRGVRLWLPGAGWVASAAEGGRFRLDLGVLAEFVTACTPGGLARPAPAGRW